MPVVISCVNLKGGVGKTAIAVNFAAFCGRQGLKTLLVDLDPQTNATFSCIKPEKWSTHKKEHGTVADLLGVRNASHAEGNNVTAGDVIITNVFKNVDLVPSDLSLFTIDLDIGARTARERLLALSLFVRIKLVMSFGFPLCRTCWPRLTPPAAIRCLS